MDTIIGLGSAGCKIADKFKNYPQYNIYKIDTDADSEENTYVVPKRNSPEDYERNCPDLSDFLRYTDDNVLFITAGGGQISGMALKALSFLKHKNISVLYIRAAEGELSKAARVQDRLVRNVFQEYARSGLFKKLYMLSNSNVENIIGDLPIFEHYNKLNDFIVSTIHWINVFDNTEAVVDNMETPKESARISTFGILNLKTGEESLFYPLDNISDKNYYYAINENVLKTDGKLLKTIREQVANNDCRASFQIHSTKYSESFCYYVAHTNITKVE